MESAKLRDMHLSSARDRERLAAFLEASGLALEADLEYAAALWDDEDRIVACGGYGGAVLKCFAVSPHLRGENVLGRLISHLVGKQFARGIHRISVYTKPDNVVYFEQNGFYPVCGVDKVVLLENVRGGPKQFTDGILCAGDAGKQAGAIVMNCNPFTLGHRHLIEYAASRCELLHVFVVEEDRSVFPFAARHRLVKEGTAHLDNVRVQGSGPYIISASTFPTYFLKEETDTAGIHARLDVTLFAEQIARPLGITTRFVGEEPNCMVTRAYNDAMREILPHYGIVFEEIPRIAAGGQVISASVVRKLLKEEGITPRLRDFVPESTYQYLSNSDIREVVARIREVDDPV